MKIVSNQKEVLKVLNEFRSSVLLQYGEENKVISRITGASIDPNGKDIILNVCPLKHVYKLKRHTFLTGVKGIACHKNNEKEVSVSFFQFK